MLMNQGDAASRPLISTIAEARDTSAWLQGNASNYPPRDLLEACRSALLDLKERVAIAKFLFAAGSLPRTGSSTNPCDVDDTFVDVWLDIILADATPAELRRELGPLLDEDPLYPGLSEARLDDATQWFADVLSASSMSEATLSQLLSCERFMSDGVLLSSATPASLLQREWDSADKDSLGWGVPVLILRNPNVSPALAEAVIDWMIQNQIGGELSQVAVDAHASPEVLAKLAAVAVSDDLADLVDELLENPSLPGSHDAPVEIILRKINFRSALRMPHSKQQRSVRDNNRLFPASRNSVKPRLRYRDLVCVLIPIRILKPDEISRGGARPVHAEAPRLILIVVCLKDLGDESRLCYERSFRWTAAQSFPRAVSRPWAAKLTFVSAGYGRRATHTSKLG